MTRTSDFTLLTSEQIWENKQLDILNRYGTKAAATDLAVILGAYVNSDVFVETSTGKARTSWWWSASEIGNSVRVVSSDGS